MISSINDFTTLNNGLKMPWLGFGVFKVQDGKEVEQAVSKALEVGYRSIDTASFYKNEKGVGNAIQASGISRQDIFLTTKIWNDDQRQQRVLEAFEESLNNLGTDYVDLYLIHWPVKECYLKTWEVMQDIYASGRAKAIGVSNFLEHHLTDILTISQIVPMVNQIEFHPRLVQPQLLDFCEKHHIQVEAWAPLMQGKMLTEKTVLQLAEKYQKSTSQIVLRWDIQHNVITIPKSISPDRIVENSKIFDFELSESDMKTLDEMDEGKRVGSHPDTFTF